MIELKYDREIKKMKDKNNIREQNIIIINNVDFLTDEYKNGKILIINNRVDKEKQRIKELKELQKPVMVTLAI